MTPQNKGGLSFDEFENKENRKTNLDETMDGRLARGFFSTHDTLAHKPISSCSFDKS